MCDPLAKNGPVIFPLHFPQPADNSHSAIVSEKLLQSNIASQTINRPLCSQQCQFIHRVFVKKLTLIFYTLHTCLKQDSKGHTVCDFT
ncbi:hypothetical protein LSAT2_032639, partial [Lamellibrachia satsuma]